VEKYELTQPVNTELLTRCAQFVNEHLGIVNHSDIVTGQELRPLEATYVYVEMHNRLSVNNCVVQNDTLEALGYGILNKNGLLDFERRVNG